MSHKLSLTRSPDESGLPTSKRVKLNSSANSSDISASGVDKTISLANTSVSEDLEAAAKSLFNAMDENMDGHMSRQEFVAGLLSLKEVDISEIECERLFVVLDSAGAGFVTVEQFIEEMHRYRWLSSVVRLYHKSVHCNFETRKDYNYSLSTNENYAFQPPEGAARGTFQEFFGAFADIRATRDYSWHGNYTRERQLWQDRAVKSCLGKTEPQARPWIIYSCGAMGVGKGHVLSWLSTQGLFPLEFIVHIDPDFFKRIMPEWEHYTAAGEEAAGSLCHLESAFMQEVAQEVAMRQRQHVWVDGSLSDGAWFSSVFRDIRRRYPHYRIAVLHISASEATVRERIKRRSAATGRNIPESQIVRSLVSPEQSIQVLACQCDLVVRIVNESNIVLKSVEDHSGDWRGGLQRHFGCMSHQPPAFPASLGPLYLEKTSLLGRPFIAAVDEAAPDSASSLQTFALCSSAACVASPYLRTFLAFAAQSPCASACLLTMTPAFHMEYHHDMMDQMGVPHGTDHYRFVFPTTHYRDVYSAFSQQHAHAHSSELRQHQHQQDQDHPQEEDQIQQPADIESVDWSDPDILFFRNGGFVYFDREDAVLGVLALSSQPTRHFCLYHNPETLDARDADRLHALERWRPITKPDLKAKGAKYFTFIYPKEQLATRQFSDHGTFAYLFREPHELPSSQDRYFNPMLKY